MKKSCEVDKRRFDSGTCQAYEYFGGRDEYCSLGYKMKNRIPLEQCPKPKNTKEFLELANSEVKG